MFKQLLYQKIDVLCTKYPTEDITKYLLKALEDTDCELTRYNIMKKLEFISKRISGSISSSEFMYGWPIMWSMYCIDSAFSDTITRLISRVALNISQSIEICKFLEQRMMGDDLQAFIWWKTIRDLQEFNEKLFENTFIASVRNNNSRAYLYLSQYVQELRSFDCLHIHLPTEGWWESTWWNTLNQLWIENKTQTEDFIQGMDNPLNVPSIKLLKDALQIYRCGESERKGSEDDFDKMMLHLVSEKQPLLTDIWLRLAQQPLDIPLEVYHTLSDYHLFIYAVGEPTLMIVFNLLNSFGAKNPPQEVKEWIGWWLSTQMEYPPFSLPMCLLFIEKQCASLLQRVHLCSQVTIVHSLISNEIWCDDTFKFLKLIDEKEALLKLYLYFEQNYKNTPLLKKYVTLEINNLEINNLEINILKLSIGTSLFGYRLRKYLKLVTEPVTVVKQLTCYEQINQHLITPNIPHDFKINGVAFHKFMLSIHSEYFNEILKGDFADDEIQLPFSDNSMKAFHSFIYQGKQNTVALYECYLLADYLGAQAWGCFLKRLIVENVNTDTLEDSLSILQKTKDTQLRDTIVAFISTDNHLLLAERMAERIFEILIQ